ncbi:MAG: putative channel-forming protein [Ilumatobacteraceae bacterium]|nr:putative channel-forming protein [Ilumatobacteraceae bacterium]
MINIRYHIVSITAVFLALGIGVALGSTFLDKATVNVLERQISSAENRIRSTNEENDRLNQQVSQARERDASLILVGSESLLADQLTDVPVLVVAAPGVDNDAISVMQTILQRSGADFRGTVQLADKLDFTGDVDSDLAIDLDLADPAPVVLRNVVNAKLTNALLAAGTPLNDDGTTRTETPTTTTTTTVPGLPAGCCTLAPPEGEEPAAITVLRERGYLKVTPGPDHTEDDPILETTGYRYVYLGGPDLDATENQVLMNVLPATGPAMPATVVSATQAPAPADEDRVPTVVARVRASDELVSRYSTVDDAQTFAGLVATVFTLRDMGEVDPGQYGQAEGATSVLPPS